MRSGQSEQSKSENSLFYGYLTLASCFLILMTLYGAHYSFGVFLKPVLEEFGWTRAATTAPYSLNLLFFGFWSILTGRLTDRFGSRVVITASGLLVTLSYLLMSQISAIWQIYVVYGILLSLGAAGTYVPVLSTVARSFDAKRGLSTGIVSAGVGVGVMIMPPVANLLITGYNWRISFMLIGSMAFMIPVIAQFLKSEPGRTNNLVHSADETPDKTSNYADRGLLLKQAIRTREFWLISVMFFSLATCLHSVMVHIVAYATDEKISSNIAATILSTIGVVSTVSKVGMGIAIDRFRSKAVWICVGVLMLISFLLLQLPGLLVLLYVFAVIFAVGYGGFAAAISPTIAEYFGLRAHGGILGISTFAIGIGGALGPYLTGLVFDARGRYTLAFLGCGVISFALIIVAILLRPPGPGGNLKVKG